MKQLVQDMRSGETELLEVPVPNARAGTLLVRTAASVVSPGTERMLISFASKSLLAKARERPDLVRQVLDKVRREGVLTTLEAVRSRLDEPLPLGYSSAGEVVEVGAGVQEFQRGMRVACAGGGHAIHGEYAVVPKNLAARVPASVDDETAAFATLGAVALHGYRLAQVEVGARVAIIGLGLVGSLAMMIVRAAGCQPFGIDVSQWRVQRLKQLGFAASVRTGFETAAVEGKGFDAVLICADTEDSDPVELAGELARDRARVVAVGAVGMELPRRSYYQKELDFVVSRSYGPGRYDPVYEERGVDYPIGYVRWTEGRNLAAFLGLVESGRLDPRELITHHFEIDDGPAAYRLLAGSERERALAVVLTYPRAADEGDLLREPISAAEVAPAEAVRLGAVGAGNFATNVLFPKLKGIADLTLVGLASARGLSSAEAARRFGFSYATAQFDQLLQDERINTIAVLTRHHLHSEQVVRSLSAGRHVFCEKPLALEWSGLAQVRDSLEDSTSLLTVGFNRRFAPMMGELRAFLEPVAGPIVLHYRINAGKLPGDHWLNDPEIGGGRLIGEVCHFIDAATYLCRALPKRVYAVALAESGGPSDSYSLTLEFGDGSRAAILYTSGGDRVQGKELLEVFGGGRSASLQDFRRLETFAGGRRRVSRSWLRQDKGHRAIWQAFAKAIADGGPPPIPYDQLLAVSAATLAAAESTRSGRPEPVVLVKESG